MSDKVTLLRLGLPKALASKSLAGGWAWIQIPKISWQWHPFSITNASDDTFVEFHIAKAGMVDIHENISFVLFCSVGDWTQALHSCCEDPLNAVSKLGPVFIEGPVGFMGSALKKYEYLLLIGAGIGK